jgi:hypothetical protein
VRDRVTIARAGDLAALLPQGLPAAFTTAELAAGLARPRHLAQQLAYCLRTAGAIRPVGKRGRAVEYRLASRAVGPEGGSSREGKGTAPPG